MTKLKNSFETAVRKEGEEIHQFFYELVEHCDRPYPLNKDWDYISGMKWFLTVNESNKEFELHLRELSELLSLVSGGQVKTVVSKLLREEKSLNNILKDENLYPHKSLMMLLRICVARVHARNREREDFITDHTEMVAEYIKNGEYSEARKCIDENNVDTVVELAEKTEYSAIRATESFVNTLARQTEVLLNRGISKIFIPRD